MVSHAWVVTSLDHTYFSRFGQLATCTQPNFGVHKRGRILRADHLGGPRRRNTGDAKAAAPIKAIAARTILFMALLLVVALLFGFLAAFGDGLKRDSVRTASSRTAAPRGRGAPSTPGGTRNRKPPVMVTFRSARVVVFIPPLETRPRRQGTRPASGLARAGTRSHIRSARRRAARAQLRCPGPGAVNRRHRASWRAPDQ